ncbi:cytochrome P450, cyclodipeptide synthase-associated [Allonocardiopsis opalescens]|uniref:Pulcherriminic acid synthase n=1 Tax=Allonocardiopsis opalescens TaxID=1144618 RepID=A0A2T0Q4T2_9ACTN|nr:cytochrome P450, cyclodipeptide synthase-associated [Allonocardiopsis opalescens]PRX98828.1 pulcherriminic acid synthase [Allonocardiopsis opalescens]
MTLTASEFSVLDESFHDDPYRFFAEMRESRPVHYEPAIDSYFVTRHRDVKAILTDDETFTTAPLQVRAEPVMRGPVLAQMTGAEHSAKRKIVVRGFAGRVLAKQAEMIRANARELIEPFLPTGRVDIVNDFGKQFAVYVTLDVLGLDKRDWRQVAQWHSAVAEYVTTIILPEDRRRHGLHCAEELERYLLPIIEERRADPGDDLISRLCTAEYEGIAMSTRDVTALIMNVLAAATEPTDKTLAQLFRHLIDHPDQLAQVLEDPALVPAAIAETMRHTPPVHLIPRQPWRPVEVADTPIPAGKTVFCMIGSANRDPDAFADPDTFDIHRPDLGTARSFTAAAHHMAFGTGLHQCVGAAFAKVEIETAAEVLLGAMRDPRYGEDFQYREEGLYTRGPVALPIRFTPVPAPAPA